MKAVGVIVEYNPFHNGHYYHIQESQKVTEADIVVAVMSGNFLQRGEPALVSKWARTKMALQGGVDLVIELPYAFATQKAETFALGAISLLAALDVDYVCFGSESGEIHSFLRTLQIMNERRDEFNDNIKTPLQEGKSYPRAAADAFRAMNILEEAVDLSLPNNILGFHYLQAIDTLNCRIQPYTIKRTKANYHDPTFNDQHIASATSIRNALFSENKKMETVRRVMPTTTFSELQSYKHDYGILHDWEAYFPFLKYRLLSMSKDELQLIYEIEEGLENRLLRMITASASFHDFIKKVKTKRYTWTRLQRACVHILTNTTKSVMKNNHFHPTYIRLLGASLKGQQYLNTIKKRTTLPLVSKLSGFTNDQILLDIKAANIYASCLQKPCRSQMIQAEFAQPPIRYNQDKKIFLTEKAKS